MAIDREKLKELASKGVRPKQMAEEFGVSRQAVQQALKKAGVTLPPLQRAPRPPRLHKLYGLPQERVRHLQAIGATRAYTYQRRNAKSRGIGWELTFHQWWDIWERSGKWDLRGVWKGGYVMGRNGDIGPYAVGNVVICSHKENIAVRESHSPSTFGRVRENHDCV